ncbi:MAG: LacI family transcriptional regulator [Gammaproteobacteria bacterium]|nr:LacI family transcriptional regulator [Gammaproteobacteria bacterium]
MPNIREVARHAGVSVASVSRTLKDPDKVALKTRVRVLKAVKETGYRPNLLARKLSSGKSFTLIVLVPNIANPFFSKVIRGIEQAAQDRGYSILLGDTKGKPELEHFYASMTLTNQADGLIQLAGRNPFSPEDAGLAESIPMVNACERIAEDDRYPVIEFENQGGANAIAQHLLELGHSRIGVITGPMSSPVVRDRLKGFSAGMRRGGFDLSSELVVNGEFDMSSGQSAAAVLLSVPEPPSAIFCMNDEMAIGAIHQIKTMGLLVPDDISVVGFDGIEFALYTDPPLTTIRQPAEKIGHCAVDNLCQIINGKPLSSRHIVLPFELAIGGSSGCYRNSV